MKKFILFPLFLAVFCFLNSCIAMKNDIDMAKSELRAETTAKMKILEENVAKSVQDEIAKLYARLDEIEKSQQAEKQMQKNKIDLSFNNLEELRETIKELNNRIDSVDLTAQKSTIIADQLASVEKKIAENETELAKLKEEINAQIEGLKPVDKFTVTKEGIIRLPENSEKSYNQLVEYTKSGNCDPAIARKAWETFADKWPETRKCDAAFWIGETYYMEKSYNKAIETLQPIEKTYPGCPKIERSYLHIAFSLFHIGKVEVANAIFESMKQKFPQPAFPDEVKELEKLINSKMPKKAAPAKTPAKQKTKTPAKAKK
ncbi:tetratricopeptide repeat protein [bacterium]|nr:tetratricopeptide repeat protein [bacterium]